MVNKKILAICTFAIALLSGCTSQADHAKVYSKDIFEIDNSTVHRNAERDTEQSSSASSESVEEHTEPSYTGEIQIENNSNEAEYTVNGNDIVYLTKTFKNLNSSIDTIASDSPYTKNEMINFITKVLYREFKSDTIDTSVTKDPDEPEDEYTTVNDSLEAIESYELLCDKYSDVATWELVLESDTEQLMIVGCKSFIAALNQEGNMNIDMSDYQESGIPNVVLDDGTIIDGDDYVKGKQEQQAVENAVENYNDMQSSESTEQQEEESPADNNETESTKSDEEANGEE